MRIKGQACVLLLVLGLLFFALISCVSPVVANPLTTVTLELQEEASVDVSPGSAGVVTLHGTVKCVKYGPDPVKVFLFANSTSGSASVVPGNFVFSGSSGAEQTDTFSVTTRVAQGTSCYETHTVTVDGYYDQGGMQYEIVPVSGTIIIEQYYLIVLKSEKGFSISTKSGDHGTLEFDIHNEGNGNDVFLVDFENRKEMEDQGFDLPEPTEVAMPEKAVESLKLRIETPEDKSGDFELKLSVTSQGSNKTSNPVKVIKVIPLEVEERSIAEKIGSIILSPLVIAIIVIIIVVAIIVKLKRR